MYPEERKEVDVRKRMAMVEIIRESCTFIERSSDWGSVKGKDGENIAIYSYILMIFYYETLEEKPGLM